MICRNCGSRIPEGKLYCQFCGEEVQLVPEYSSADMQLIRKRMEEEELEREKKAREQEAEERRMRRRMKPAAKVLCVLAAALFACALMYGVHFLILHSRALGYGSLMAEAKTALSEGKPEMALSTLVRAEELMPEHAVELPLLKSDTLFALGDREEAYAILNGLASRTRNVEIVKKLIDSLRADGRHEDVIALLDSLKLPELRELYPEYSASAPVMSLENGATYPEGTRLALTAEGEGTIYYTTDGSEADESSRKYRRPLKLKVGTNHIKAVYVNRLGVMSKPSVAVFNISPDKSGKKS